MVDQREIDDIVRHFEDLEDPRSEVNLQHPLISVVVISLMAVLAGASGPTAIARWAQLKADELLNVLPLPKGIPRKDVFRRVLSALKPEAFQTCFANWLASLRARAAAATGIDQPVLAVDGKTLRRSHDRRKGLGALHSVSVWASEFGLTLGQVATEEKSNEITAIPEVLKLVDLQGAIVTIDAMGTQKAIAAQVVELWGRLRIRIEREPEQAARGGRRLCCGTMGERLCRRPGAAPRNDRKSTWPRRDADLPSDARAPEPAGVPPVERSVDNRCGGA